MVVDDSISLRCFNCKQELPPSDFPVDKGCTRRHGRSTRCRACGNANRKAWHAANRARGIAASRAWKETNKERVKDYQVAYDKSRAESKRAYGKSRKEQNREVSARYVANHPEKVRHYAAKYYAANAESIKAKSAKYRKSNKAYFNARNAGRKSARIAATPAWADIDAIRLIYAKSVDWRMVVDHVVPLKSKLVCGLHTQDNLQLLTDSENLRKGNRWWPDMP